MYEILLTLHLVFGIAWAGAGLLLGLVLIPAIARAPKEDRGIARTLMPKVTPFMASTSGMAMLTGLGLLWVTGRFADFVSPGTLLALFALVLVAGHGAYAAREIKEFLSLIEAGDDAEIKAFAGRFSLFAVAVTLVVVLIMSGFAIGHI